jgi:putative effector of murein hydrolase
LSKSLKVIFLVHAVVSALLGVLFLVIPGRFLGWFGWAPIDPIISRLLGAALIALAWSSYRGWRAAERAQVAILIELEAVFCVLASLGMLRHLVMGSWPWYAWLLFAGFAGFAVAWLYALVRK